MHACVYQSVCLSCGETNFYSILITRNKGHRKQFFLICLGFSSVLGRELSLLKDFFLKPNAFFLYFVSYLYLLNKSLG